MSRWSKLLLSVYCVAAVACGNDTRTIPDMTPAPDMSFVNGRPALPQLPKNSDSVLSPLHLVTIVTSGDPIQQDLFAFSDALIKSDWFPTVAKDYGISAPAGNTNVTGPVIDAGATCATSADCKSGQTCDGKYKVCEIQFSEQQLLSYIDAATLGNGPARPTGSSLFLVYLPAGVNFVDHKGDDNTNCKMFLGIHYIYGSGGDAYAVVQRCPPDPNQPTMTPTKQSTVTASHEIIEASTDAVLPNGYTLGWAPQVPVNESIWKTLDGPGSLVENADLCLGTLMQEGNYFYQRSWSNAAAATGAEDPCVPALTVPFYNAWAPQEWYSVAAGGSLNIPVTAWTTGKRADWAIVPIPIEQSVPGWKMSVTTGTEIHIGIGGYTSINDGRTGMLTVTAPKTAPSSAYVILWLYSFDPTVDPWTAAVDQFHYWPVGVYVQ